VAAFSRASMGRLLLVQLLIALLVAGSVIWFLAAAWSPVIREAIRQLPDTGAIEGQRLQSPHDSTAPLADNRFLSIVVDMAGTGAPSRAADLRVEFRRDNFTCCSLLGCLTFSYPRGQTVQFNRPELESRRIAWQSTLYVAAGIGVVAWLFASWLLLATLYWPVVRLYAFFKDRQLTLAGSWKLAAAALLPGALLVTAGLVLYGLGVIDLLRFLLLWGLHLMLGWVYLFISPLCLPRTADAVLASPNPFGASGRAAANPFAKPGSEKKSIEN
jgi:hypothetical protein